MNNSAKMSVSSSHLHSNGKQQVCFQDTPADDSRDHSARETAPPNFVQDRRPAQRHYINGLSRYRKYTNSSSKPPPTKWTIVELDKKEKTYSKTDNEWVQLDSMIQEVFDKNRLSDSKKVFMAKVIEELEVAIRELDEMKGGSLLMHGSVANGCGTTSSDLDMTFQTQTEQDVNGILNGIRDILSKRYVGEKFPKPKVDAKIPILKFKLYGIYCDISVNNDTALKNTVLIQKYCEWEPERFPQLALFIKRWAKDCAIHSAAQGGLSSYALTLMLIHYLQQCSPPVFPSWKLNKKTVPEGYDFAKEPVDEKWTKNRQTVGQLFVEFLKYYSRFNFDKLISTVSEVNVQEDLIDKQKKDFKECLSNTGRKKQFAIAIEDPYRTEFNAAHAVHDKFKKIIAVFRHSRNLFMGECKYSIWDESLIWECCSIYQKEKRRLSKSPSKFKVERKEREIEKTLPASEHAVKDPHPIFEAIFCCGGEGTFRDFKCQYKLVEKKDFIPKKTICEDKSKLFDHPFLKECVVFQKDGSFKLKDDLYKRVSTFVKELRRSGDPNKKNVEEGAQRFLDVVHFQDKLQQKYFSSRYQKMFKDEFNEEEKIKYFNTANMDEIAEMISIYGLEIWKRDNGTYFFKEKSILSSEKAKNEVQRLIQDISASLENKNKMKTLQELK